MTGSATKRSRIFYKGWIASLTLAMTALETFSSLTPE